MSKVMLRVLSIIALANFAFGEHPDVGLDIFGMVARQGYPLENHTITTEDGYILQTHRIPHGLNNAGEPNKKVAFLMHGLSCSSVDWVNNGPDKSLAYILADLGYDVWLGNARGTKFGRHHVTWDPDVDQAQFWNISWNEMGYYDLPANFDYILELTGQEKLYYFAHSQGTTNFFVMGSNRPEYNDKIALATILAPVTFQNNMYSPMMHFIAQYEEDMAWLMANLGIYEFEPSDNLTLAFGKECDEGGYLEELCRNIIFLMCGYDSQQLNSTLLPVILSNLPGGSASKQYIHFAQEINSELFRQFDYYGAENNTKIYGVPEPPNYDLTKVTAPVALHYGKNDWVVGLKDVDRLKEKLPNLVYDNLIDYEYFNHFDFLWATDIRELLYDEVLEVLSQY